KAANVPILPVVYGFDMAKRQTAVYVLCLLPIPLFLTSLGNFFVVVMSILNLVWAYIAIRGVFKKDDEKYADTMFFYSLGYLTIMFGLMIFFTLHSFQVLFRKPVLMALVFLYGSISSET